MSLREAVGRRPYRVAFSCVDDGARAIVAAALLARLATADGPIRPRFIIHAHREADARPIDPCLETLLRRLGHEAWPEAETGPLPAADLSFRLCGPPPVAAFEAAGASAVWSGLPLPAADALPILRAQAWADLYGRLHNRLQSLVNLPFDSLDRLTLAARVRALGSASAPAR